MYAAKAGDYLFLKTTMYLDSRFNTFHLILLEAIETDLGAYMAVRMVRAGSWIHWSHWLRDIQLHIQFKNFLLLVGLCGGAEHTALKCADSWLIIGSYQQDFEARRKQPFFLHRYHLVVSATILHNTFLIEWNNISKWHSCNLRLYYQCQEVRLLLEYGTIISFRGLSRRSTFAWE